MIEVIPFEKIDREKWDHCIFKSNQGNIYGLYDSICIACDKWIGIVHNNYEAVMALPLKKKLGLTYSWHPQFMGPMGIFAPVANPEYANEFFKEISHHSWWIKMFYWQSANQDHIVSTAWKYQQLIMKDKTMDDIRGLYNENTKRNRQKAIRQQLSVKNISDVDLVIGTFKENKGNQIENINEDSYVLLKRLMEFWLQKKNGHITAVYEGDVLQAIGYFLTWKNILIYYKGAVTEAGKQSGAMHYLIDHEINDHIGKYDIFDFGGSNTDSVARFYKGFGAEDAVYYLNEYKKFKI